MPQQAPARNERPANHQPQRITSSSGRIGRGEVAAQDVERDRHREMRDERRDQLGEIDLPPVDRGDHRPQHEGEVARLVRALEQPADQLGADERVLVRRVGDLADGAVDESGTRDHESHRLKKGMETNIWCMTERNAHYCIKNIKKGL